MKTWMIVIFLTAFVFLADAQDLSQNNVPSLVLNTFQSKYANATDVEWELKDEVYQVEFEIDTKDHDLWIDKSGNITKHKEDFPKAQLPAAVLEKIETEFLDYKIDDVDRVEMDGNVFFEVDLDGKLEDREVSVSIDGTIQSNKID